MKQFLIILFCIGFVIFCCYKYMCLKHIPEIKQVKYSGYCQGFFDGSKIDEQPLDKWAELLGEARQGAMKYSGRER